MNDTSAERESFWNALSGRPLVFDGAMGTMLYERGYFINRSFDEANLIRSETVRQIHREHIDAGADIVETNTFSANRYLLDRYGVGDKVLEINREGVAIAREAAGEEAWVAGAIGPTGLARGVLPAYRREELRAAFEEQIQTLVDGGIDLLVLETFHHLGEMRLALEVARKLFDLPIVAQMSFQEDCCLRDGTPPKQVAQILASLGADVVGVNCCEGPAIVHDVAAQMVEIGLPVSAQPNAGRPRRLDQRSIYMATPEYVGVYARRFLKAGVRLVGGCCGTGPEHVSSIAAAARMFGGGAPRQSIALVEPTDGEPELGLEPIPTEERSAFAAKVTRIYRDRLRGGQQRRNPKGPEEFVSSVEVNPPHGVSTKRAIKAARMLFEAGVDVINIADGPRASVRMSNTALALEVMKEFDREVLLHLCCRDRNLLGLQSDILGSHVLGIHNLVIITGDPPKMGDYPSATAVFDLDSIELLKLVDGLNRGIDPAGKMVGERTNFFLMTGVEPAALDYAREMDRLRKKIDAGAELILTQPVYDYRVVERFLDDVESLGVPVLLGLCPLVSHRNAEFLHNEVPGMSVPEEIRRRLEKKAKGSEAQAEGALIAQEMLESFKDRIVGTYLMPQLGRYGMALSILANLGLANTESS